MLTLLLACAPEAPVLEDAETEWIQDLTVGDSEWVPTALEVRFTTPAEATAWVEYGVDGTTLRTPLSEPGTSHAVPVIGNPALSEVSLQVVVEIDGEQHTSGVFAAETGQLLPETPTLDVTVNDYTDAPENTRFLMSIFGPVNYVVMADLDGNITWSMAQGEKDVSYGLSVVPRDGSMLYNLMGIGDHTNATIEQVDLLGRPIESISTPDAHHFFTEGADDSLVWLEEDIREVDGVDIVGDVLMRRDAKGEETVLFSHWETFTLPSFNISEGSLDWTHSNWVDWDEERGTYLISNAYINTIAELDTDGTPLRIMGGPGAVDSEYVFGSVQQAFEYPHGPHWTDDGDLLVFSTTDGISRAIRYEVDDTNSQLNEVWSFGTDLGYEALWMGEVAELPDGNVLVSWGSVGLLQVVSPEGAVLWEAYLPFQSFFNQVHVMEDPYMPWK